MVCVSTYPPTHEAVAMEALRLPLQGIPVEKPLGHTVDSGRRIVDAVRHRSVPMAVPHGLLVKRSVQEIVVDRFESPAPQDWDPGRPYSGQGSGRDGRKLL